MERGEGKGAKRGGEEDRDMEGKEGTKDLMETSERGEEGGFEGGRWKSQQHAAHTSQREGERAVQ